MVQNENCCDQEAKLFSCIIDNAPLHAAKFTNDYLNSCIWKKI